MSLDIPSAHTALNSKTPRPCPRLLFSNTLGQTQLSHIVSHSSKAPRTSSFRRGHDCCHLIATRRTHHHLIYTTGPAVAPPPGISLFLFIRSGPTHSRPSHFLVSLALHDCGRVVSSFLAHTYLKCIRLALLHPLFKSIFTSILRYLSRLTFLTKALYQSVLAIPG